MADESRPNEEMTAPTPVAAEAAGPPTGPPAAPGSTPATADPQPYNFLLPPRVSKDRRATLDAVYGRFAGGLEALFTSRLRAPTDVTVMRLEQVGLMEWVRSLRAPCAVCAFRLADRSGSQGLLDLGPGFALHLVDRVLGGPGDSHSAERPLTTLEETVVGSLVERVLGLLRDAWEEHVPMSPELLGFESNPDALPVAGLADTVLVTSFAVRCLSIEGTLTLAIPMAAFEWFLAEEAASRHVHPAPKREQTPQHRTHVEAALAHALVDVSARFPLALLSARSLATLREGQVVHLGQPADTPVEVLVNGRLHYVGSLGQHRGRVGLRILRTAGAPASDRPGRCPEGRVL